MKRKFLAPVSILVVFALLFSFSACSLTGGNEEETTSKINVKTPLPTDITSSYDEESRIVTDTQYSPEALAANTKTIFEYFNLHINKIKQGKAAVSMSRSKSIGKAVDENGDAIPISENSYVNAAITTLDSYMLNTSGDSIEYGDSLQEFLPVKGENYVSRLTLDDIESATCAEDGTRRVITLTLKSPAQPQVIEKAYDMENLDEILKEFEKANGYMSVEKPELTYKDCRIIITADVETDEITAIEYEKTADVKTTVTGKGNLESIGTLPVIFNYRSNVRYSLDWTDPATATTLAEK